MQKVVCTATIADAGERDLICEWLRKTPNCSYSVVGKTVTANYPALNKENSDVYWGLVHMFEHYAEHSVTNYDSP